MLSLNNEFHGRSITYQKLDSFKEDRVAYNDLKNEIKNSKALLILDEAHHAAERTSWLTDLFKDVDAVIQAEEDASLFDGRKTTPQTRPKAVIQSPKRKPAAEALISEGGEADTPLLIRPWMGIQCAYHEECVVKRKRTHSETSAPSPVLV